MKGNENFAIVILAAGKGTRMHSSLAKVLHPVGGLPMIVRIVEEIRPMNAYATIVVVGYQGEKVQTALAEAPVSFVRQAEQLGTGHALMCALPAIPAVCSHVLVLYGDTPLITRKTLAGFFANHLQSRSILTVLATCVDNPEGYGRLLLSEKGAIQGIVEERDASSEEKKIKIVNSGIYCFDRQFLEEELPGLSTNNRQGEFYLTDLVAKAVARGQAVTFFRAKMPEEVMGINSPEELAKAEDILHLREKS